MAQFLARFFHHKLLYSSCRLMPQNTTATVLGFDFFCFWKRTSTVPGNINLYQFLSSRWGIYTSIWSKYSVCNRIIDTFGYRVSYKNYYHTRYWLCILRHLLWMYHMTYYSIWMYFNFICAERQTTPFCFSNTLFITGAN